jgi:integrase/recombinase XerC
MRRLDAFADYLQHERRCSPHTLTAYVNDVAQFFAFMKSAYGFDEAESVKPTMVKSWIYELSKDKVSARSINRKRTSLNTFYKFLRRTEEVKINPVATVSSLKTEKRLARFVPEDGMTSLLDEKTKSGEHVFPEGFEGIRDRLLLELLYDTGIRLSELVGLKNSDVHLSAGTIKVLGKRNKERIIPIPETLSHMIREYQAAVNTAGFVSETLMLTDKGEPVYPVFVQRKVKHYLSQVSTLSKISPHLLRHTYATHLLNKGAEIGAIKELLGHANLAATQIYTHNSIDRLKGIFNLAHPRGDGKKSKHD